MARKTKQQAAQPQPAEQAAPAPATCSAPQKRCWLTRLFLFFASVAVALTFVHYGCQQLQAIHAAEGGVVPSV